MVRIRYQSSVVDGKSVLVSARPILAGEKVFKVVLDGQLGKLLNNTTEEVEYTVTASTPNKLKVLVKSTLKEMGANFSDEVRVRAPDATASDNASSSDVATTA